MQRSIEIERFVKPISDDYLCPICLNVIAYPDADDQGHLFCSKCIERWLKNKSTCPLNRSYLNFNQLRPLRKPLKQLFDELEVFCVNKKYGCKQICQLKSLHSHQNECEASKEYFKLNPNKPRGYIASACYDMTVKIWDLENLKCAATLHNENPITSMVVSESGELVGCSLFSGIFIWNTKTEECVKRIDTLKTSPEVIAVLKNGLLAAPVEYGRIKLFNIKTGECVKMLKGQIDTVKSMVVLENGHLATGSYDGYLNIWDVDIGTLVHRIKAHTRDVNCMAVLFDSCLASGSYDSKIKIWNSNTCKQSKTYENHAGFIGCLTRLNNGHLASGCSDGKIKIWNTETDECIHTLIGPMDFLKILIVLNDDVIISGSTDKRIKIWDIKAEKCIGTIKGHTSIITSWLS